MKLKQCMYCFNKTEINHLIKALECVNNSGNKVLDKKTKRLLWVFNGMLEGE